MADYATKKDVQEIVSASNQKVVEGITGVLRDYMDHVDERFNSLELAHQRLLSTVDGFVGRIDSYEQELRMRDRQLERLVEWAKKVSEKTGIPLESL